MKPNVILIATYDTKGAEAEYIKERVLFYGADCLSVDSGSGQKPLCRPDVSLDDLCAASGKTADDIRAMPRGEGVAFVSGLTAAYVSGLLAEKKADAVIGVGGAGGTQIVTQALRALPFGFPKLILSTLASGNTRWYLEETDLAMFPSVADIAGLNSVSKLVFDRFAATAAAQAKWYREAYAAHEAELVSRKRFRVGMTMYGTTTVGVENARAYLERNGMETVVFHASGAGGRSMEGFVRSGVIHGVLDMTLAEIGAHLVGGLHDAGSRRLEAMVDMEIPYVMVPAGADTIVLPPMAALPAQFKTGRILNFHNPTMTTMRTNIEENVQIGEFIVGKLRHARQPVKILVPMGGLSSIDRPGAVFYLPGANEALLYTLKKGFTGTSVTVIEDSRHLYDPGFGEDAAKLMLEQITEILKVKEKEK